MAFCIIKILLKSYFSFSLFRNLILGRYKYIEPKTTLGQRNKNRPAFKLSSLIYSTLMDFWCEIYNWFGGFLFG